MADISDFRKTAPAVTDFPWLSLPEVETVTLQNGVRLHFLDNPRQPVVRISIMYPSGLAESPDRYALSLLPETIRESSADMTGAEFSELLDYYGAWLTSGVSAHHFMLTLHALTESFDYVFTAVMNTIGTPVFKDDEVDAITRRKSAGARVSRDKVATIARQSLNRMLFGEGHPAVAESDVPEEILKVTPERIRCEWQQEILNNSPQVFIAGNASHVRRMIEEIFSNDIYGSGPSRPITITPYGGSGGRKESFTEKAGSLQSAVYMAIPTISRKHPDYIDLRLASIALGGYFGSRLNSVIREEKGLTYGITASLYGIPEGAHLQIQSQTDNAFVSELIRETESEINRLKTEPLTHDELSALKRNAMSGLAATLDTPFNIMDLRINEITVGTSPEYFYKHQEAIGRLTAGKIMEMAREYFDTDKLLISVAGEQSK